MLYSVDLRIMGKPNIALFDKPSLFPGDNLIIISLMLIFFIACLIAPLLMFIRTEIGLRLRAVGTNPDFARSQGISVAEYTILGLFIANCYTGLAGGLMVQLQSYMDINMGVGMVIDALAALMIGESIVKPTCLNKQLIAPLVGALIYQQIQGLALTLGLAPSDLAFNWRDCVRSDCSKRKRNMKLNDFILPESAIYLCGHSLGPKH